MLNLDQIAFYQDNGFLHIPQVFTPAEMDELDAEMNRLMKEWATTNQGWTGPWRRAYMDEQTEKRSKLTAMHDLQFYSAAWLRAVTHAKLVAAMGDLLGPNVELHHSTMHVKPPSTGHPFPMHQDNPFYEHKDGRYVDVLVHLDDTSHANGEIRFLAGSHKQGAIKHVTMTEQGPCTPHLPFEQYSLESTVPVPAKRGDVVCFSIHTIHGSYINTTDKARRLVRVGYRNPLNTQIAGQSGKRANLMVAGRRLRQDGQALFTTEGAIADG
jgi:ectoine hydroxylase-related dioxygenase (phytanoyl-CoA dioxygenase family)